MENSNKKKKMITLMSIALAVVIVLSCVIGIFGDSVNITKYVGDNIDINISDTSRPTTPTTNGFSYFADGVKYVFTDKTKVDGFRAGTEDFDITTIIVKSTDVQGTQTNPHVITSIDEWEIFVKKMATDSTCGTGQYYVLGNDLDFDGEDFHPVLKFNGTFYGLGYSIKNITCDTWQYWTGSAYADLGASNIAHSGFGVFCKITNATIADLIVQDYSFQNIPQSSTLVSGHGPYNGAIAGVSYGNDSILNCHTVGEVKSTFNYTSHYILGGMVGIKYSSGSTLLTYRCSSEIDAVINLPACVIMLGGMIGYGGFANTIMHIYDCVANARWTGSARYSHVAVGIGWNIGLPTIENVIGSIDATTTSYPFSGSLLGTGANTAMKNIYVKGQTGSETTSKN